MSAWCGICNGWGEHDTAHHDSDGGLQPGDVCTVNGTVDLDHKHLIGRQGRVEKVLGNQVTVALPGRAGTTTVTLLQCAVDIHSA